jgi:hypothetical protein
MNLKDLVEIVQELGEIRLADADYFLAEGSGWFVVKNFAIRIHSTDEGVGVDIYKCGKEDEGATASCYAFDSELQKTPA